MIAWALLWVLTANPAAAQSRPPPPPAAKHAYPPESVTTHTAYQCEDGQNSVRSVRALPLR